MQISWLSAMLALSVKAMTVLGMLLDKLQRGAISTTRGV
jgi:hypothetical protein